MSRIKSLYYYGLCSVRPYRQTYLCLNTQSGNYGFKSVVENVNYELSSQNKFTVESLKKWRAEHGAIAKYVAEIKNDDIDVFILVDQQLESFNNDMDDFNLKQYIVYQSPPFMNKNYPSDGRRLHMFILHYKDYSANA